VNLRSVADCWRFLYAAGFVMLLASCVGWVAGAVWIGENGSQAALLVLLLATAFGRTRSRG
jgi:hypothetical protein